MKILIVEDDRALCETLCDALSERGVSVSYAYRGNDAIDKIIENRYDILLLDINIPQKTGFEILLEARRYHNNIAALFMTALDTPYHLEESFRVGGDDYIRKPFQVDELCMRIEAIYRRCFALRENIVTLSETLLYNTLTETLMRDNQPVFLKPKLTKLLYLFATHPTRTMTREMIEERLWEHEDLPDAAILRIYIKELREIIGKEMITTIKGVGYRLETL